MDGQMDREMDVCEALCAPLTFFAVLGSINHSSRPLGHLVSLPWTRAAKIILLRLHQTQQLAVQESTVSRIGRLSCFSSLFILFTRSRVLCEDSGLPLLITSAGT